MSVNLYDNAIVEKLKEITKDSRIFINTTDNVFTLIGKEKDDNITLPLISLARTGMSIISDRVSYPLMKTGSLAKVNKDNEYFTRLQAIPIRLNYVLDVWTESRLDNDNIVRELIFYFFTHPTLQIEIPYTVNIKHNFNLFVNPDIEDNSDISEHKSRGMYYRQTLTLYTDDAYIWKASRSNLYDVEINTQVIANNEIIEESSTSAQELNRSMYNDDN